MQRSQLLLILLIFSILTPVLAHTEGGELGSAGALEFDYNFLWLAIAALALLIFIGVKFQKQLKIKHEKVIFVGIAIVALAFTGYLTGLTVYWDLASESNGPVHWHADFEIDICGESIQLPHSSGLSGDVGTETLHHHNDMRIHVEGILVRLEEADLEHFFEAIGGELTDQSISVPQNVPPNSNSRSYANGDACPDGSVGALQVFVNGNKIEDPAEYVIAPYSIVPPGDQIRIVFGPEVSG